jgi:hypothetical protein
MFHAYMLGESATLEQNAANWMLFCTVIAGSCQRVRRLTVVASSVRAAHAAPPLRFPASPFGAVRRPIPIAATPLRPRTR